MAQTSAGPGPIPPAKKDDSEDVTWALSTAEAMYARGDRGDALKWLRRAAEAAAEAQFDDRALELAKAAADLASALGPTPSSGRPPPPAPPPIPAASPYVRSNSPAPPPRPFAGTAPARPAPPPAPPPRPVVTPKKPPSIRPVTPFAGPVRQAEIRHPGRRSRPDIVIARRPDEVTVNNDIPVHAQPAARRGDVTPPTPPAIPPAPPTPVPDRQTRPVNLASQTDEMDGWPTATLSGDEMDPPDEKTRIGVPAYASSARYEPPPRAATEPALQASQALRVVVWRAMDGVHVAPAGTRVSAISVDAVLVALDPGADLAAWLSGK